MKKTILAAAIVAASLAGAANASTIYANQENGMTVFVSGQVEAMQVHTDHALQSKSSLDNKVDGHRTASILTTSKLSGYAKNDTQVKGNVQFDINKKVNDNLTAFATFELENKPDRPNEKNAVFDDVAVGLRTSNLKLIAGETDNSLSVLEKAEFDHELENMDLIYMDHESDGHGGRVIFNPTENLALSADFQLGQAGQNDSYGASADYTVGDYSFAGAYESTGSNQNIMGFSGSAAFGNLTLAGTVSKFKNQSKDTFYADVNTTTSTTSKFAKDNAVFDKDAKYSTVKSHEYLGVYNDSGMTYALSAKYQLDQVGLYGGAEITTADVKDVNQYYVGADYKLVKDVTIFAEYANAKTSLAKTNQVNIGVDYRF